VPTVTVRDRVPWCSFDTRNPVAALAEQLEAREYDQVAVGELDTRYATLRLPAPEAVATLGRSIARHGVLQPLTVNRQSDGDGDALVVLDGFKRQQALADKPDTTVPVRIMTLTEAQATAALITFNRPHRGVSELEEAWIVQSLVRDHEMLQKDVAKLLGRHKSWVCRRVQLAQRLAEEVVDDMRLGLISATAARELVRLPRGNQARVAAAIREHGLTSRQTPELVRRVLQAPNSKSVQELLDDPMRFVDSPPAGSAHKRDARLSEPGDKLRRSLAALARQASITDRMVHLSSAGQMVCSDLEVLGPQVRDVTAIVRAVLAALAQLIGDDGADA